MNTDWLFDDIKESLLFLKVVITVLCCKRVFPILRNAVIFADEVIGSLRFASKYMGRDGQSGAGHELRIMSAWTSRVPLGPLSCMFEVFHNAKKIFFSRFDYRGNMFTC